MLSGYLTVVSAEVVECHYPKGRYQGYKRKVEHDNGGSVVIRIAETVIYGKMGKGKVKEQ